MLQLEVLELLVHHGADLNVRNKHDETPAGNMNPLNLSPVTQIHYFEIVSINCVIVVVMTSFSVFNHIRQL